MDSHGYWRELLYKGYHGAVRMDSPEGEKKVLPLLFGRTYSSQAAHLKVSMSKEGLAPFKQLTTQSCVSKIAVEYYNKTVVMTLGIASV
jgi:hypothetical protein